MGGRSAAATVVARKATPLSAAAAMEAKPKVFMFAEK